MRERRLVVVNAKNPIKSDMKRFYMKGAFVEVDCTKCKRPLKLDFGERPLNYPIFNESFIEFVFCQDCETEIPVKLILKLSMELVDK